MSLEPIGAAGDLAEGALLARVIEPNSGSIGAPHAGADCCLNCGAPVATPHCGQCGQSTHVHTTLVSIGHDLLHGLFHFEGRVWRTIPDLLIRPGELTRRYIAGERAKFVSPLALFLFAVFLMFAAFEVAGGPFRPQVIVADDHGRRLSKAEVSQQLARDQAKLAALQIRLAQLPPGSSARAAVEKSISDTQEEASALGLAVKISKGSIDAASLSSMSPATGWSSLDRRIKSVAGNPALLVERMQANAHKLSWALIPLSVPFLWLVFAWRREFRLYDHTVFIIYALAAVMLLLAAMAIVGALGLPTGWVLLLVPIHQWRQLRQAYLVTRWGATWRMLWLQLSGLLVVSLFSVILVASGLFD